MGFALTELMVVLVIIGIVLAVSVPATYKYMRSSERVGATNTLMADIYYARSLANMRRKTYQIAFVTNGYTISQVTPPATISTRTLPPGVACAATDTALFYAWGLSVPISITISSYNDSTTVQVAANGSVSHD